jgi:WD40 repeat protein
MKCRLRALMLIATMMWCAPCIAQKPLSPIRFDPPQLVVNAGSGGAVALALSPSGRFFAVPAGNAIDLWDVDKGRRTSLFTVAMSRDGKQVAAATFELGEGEIFIWDIETGRVNARLKLPVAQNYGSGRPYAASNGLAFTADGRRIIVVGSFNRRTAGRFQFATEFARVIDIATGATVRSLENTSTNDPSSIDVSPDGNSFAIGCYGGVVRVFDIDGRQIRTINGADSTARAEELSFSPDGRLLAFANTNYNKKRTDVEIWDARSGKIVRSFQGDTNGSKVGVAWSPSGEEIAIRSRTALQIWSVGTGVLVKQNQSLGNTYGSAVRYEPNGSALITSGPVMIVVDAKSLRPIKSLGENVGSQIAGTAATSSEVLIEVSNPCSIYALDSLSGSVRKHFEPNNIVGECPALVASADARKFAGAYLQGSDQIQGKLLYADMSMGSGFTALRTGTTGLPSISADGKTIAIESGKAIEIVDASSGAIRRTIPGKPSHLAYAISPDGKRLVASENTGGSDPVYLWDLSSGASTKLAQFSYSSGEEVPHEFFFSADSRTVVAPGTSPTHYAVDSWTLNGPSLLRRLSIAEDRTVNFGGVAVHPDGDKVLIGSWDAQLRLWDLKNGTLMRSYIGHVAFPYPIEFAAGGERIVSSGSDAIKIWRTETGEVLASVYITSNGEWLEVTPEGFFDASAKGAQLLSVVQGLESYSIDQFYDALHRPDLVREKLAGDPQGKVREAATKLDLGKAMASGSPPRVAIVSPASLATVTDEQVTIEASVTDAGGGIGNLEWRVNGTTLGVETVASASRQAGRTVAVRKMLTLEPGENRIEVFAYNAQGLIASDPAKVVVTLQGQVALSPPRLYVLAVGVNDYWDSRLRLAFAAADAKALGDALRKAGQSLYERVEVTMLLDGEATAPNLDRTFTELGRNVRPQDVFVFYLAGHGKTVDGRFYFIPQDFHYTGEDSIVAKGVGQTQLQQWLARIRAQKSVLLFDACESGSLTEDRGVQRGMEELTAIDRLTRAMGRTVLTATTDDKPAAEGVGGHGVFTYALLAGLGNAQVDRDGLIGVTELASYVDRRVPELSYEAFKIRQVPQMKIVGSNFPIAHRVTILPSAPSDQSAPIPTIPTHVVIASATVREAASSGAPSVLNLTPGTQVRLVETDGGWVLIARDGKKIGYVEANVLLGLQ